MAHFKVAEARARFGEILDEAEAGGPVFIERRGVRFRLVVESSQPSGESKSDLFEFVDPDVLKGQFTWNAGAKGLSFAPRRRR